MATETVYGLCVPSGSLSLICRRSMRRVRHSLSLSLASANPRLQSHHTTRLSANCCCVPIELEKIDISILKTSRISQDLIVVYTKDNPTPHLSTSSGKAAPRGTNPGIRQRIQIGMIRPIQVDTTKFLQVAIKTHSFIRGSQRSESWSYQSY